MIVDMIEEEIGFCTVDDSDDANGLESVDIRVVWKPVVVKKQ